MSTENLLLSVFTKPWKQLSVWDLATHVKDMGLDGVEFPLRDGFQLEPKNAEDLPGLVSQFADHGLRIFSVASEPDEKVFAGCADAGIPIIRVMATIDPAAGYVASERSYQQYLERLLPWCDKYGVMVGVQHHYGDYVVDSSGLLRLIEQLDQRYIGAIWDAAHDALAGQQPEFGLDILWDRLCMLNVKNAFYKCTSGPEAKEAVWERYFTTGEHGLASWPRLVAYIKKRQYKGVMCLSAEYDREDEVDRLTRHDVQYLRALINADG